MIRKVKQNPVVTLTDLQDDLKAAGRTITQGTMRNKLYLNDLHSDTLHKLHTLVRKKENRSF